MEDDKYQIECDERTLNSAAEVVANKVRLNKAMKLMKTRQKGMTKMINVLTGRRGATKSTSQY